MCSMVGVTEEQGQRLKTLRLARGFSTAADAARAFGWPVTTYQAHENGSRGLKLDAARRYAKAFKSSPAFILTAAEGGQQPPMKPSVNDVMTVPLVARVSAGSFRADDGLEIEGIQVPAVPRGDIPSGAQYATLVDGSSVNLKIPDGAYAICAPLDKYPGGPKHGQLVHVIRERSGLVEHTIKQIQFTREGMILMPVSSDPKYQEQVTLSSGEDGEIVRIAGVVIGSYQPL